MKLRWLSRFPLGLPPGSIRALMALILVGGVTYLAIVGRLEAAVLATMGTAAVDRYFNAKREKDADQPEPPTPPAVNHHNVP